MKADLQPDRVTHHLKTPSPTPLSRHSLLALAVASVISGAATLTGSSALAAAAAAADTNDTALAEVVVTARKRTETAQEIPQSIDVFSKVQIEQLDLSQFEDYATSPPRLPSSASGQARNISYMRGVSDGSNPNVSNTSSTGFFVDDISIELLRQHSRSHMYDIERIEVLNGPQGTLFGASSMSGAIRIITNKPDPSGPSMAASTWTTAGSTAEPTIGPTKAS